MNMSAIRESAFQILFAQEIQQEFSEEQIERYITENKIENDEAKKYITKITKGINTNKQEILEKIKKYLKPEWKLDRLSKINLVILKLAIYELNYTDTPFKVVINGAVELSKKYGDDTSSVFVNGILASVVGENLDENRTNNS